MAELAIKGHKTRGKEVIALLGILGGMNTREVTGENERCCYYLNSENTILEGFDPDGSRFLSYTLEEFEELYPYKLRDKVLYKDTCKWNVHWIKGMEWIDDEIRYQIDYGDGFRLTRIKTKDLRPYIEEKKESSKAPDLLWQQYSEGKYVCKIPEGIEFDKVENGVIFLESKKKELPKTYGECCEVLGINDLPYMVYTWNRNEDVEVVLLEPQVTLLQQLEVLRKLIVCRDAYWKLAGDWKFKIGDSSEETVYALTIWGSGILKNFYHALNCNRVLVFPTEEMRDTFYENFKDLIEECKELL